MATLAPFTPSRSGVAPVMVAATAADKFANTGSQILVVSNADASSHTVQIAASALVVDGITIGTKDVAVPAGATRYIGPFPTTTYNDTNGDVLLTYTSITGMTVGVLQQAVASILSPA